MLLQEKCCLGFRNRGRISMRMRQRLGSCGFYRSIPYIREFRMNSSNPRTQCNLPPAQYATHNLEWYDGVSFKSFFDMKYYSCRNVFVKKDDLVLDCQYSNRQQTDRRHWFTKCVVSQPQSASTSENLHSKILSICFVAIMTYATGF